MSATVAFDHTHLEVFEQSLIEKLDPNERGGRAARSFSQRLTGVNLSVLPTNKLSRSEVLGFSENKSIDVKTVVASILAWGGMRASHRDMLFEQKSSVWLDLCGDMRNGRYDRKRAYEQFRNLRRRNELRGMGPAYFTKLIYFLMPRAGASKPIACIMDQWAGCSINLLAGRRVVETNSAFFISDANSDENYEQFCVYVERLMSQFNLTLDEMDRALLSTGGRSPGVWRKHVKAKRTQ